MTLLPGRRALLAAALTAAALPARAAERPDATIAAYEAKIGDRLGVMAVDTGSGVSVAHRAEERFAFCSTFKVMTVSALLRRTDAEALLAREVPVTAADLVPYSPVTKPYLGHGMTVAALCAAALQYSDNTAANLLIRTAGGPAAITAFARSIGDTTFRLDRLETALNTAIPGDPRDTSTPAAMARLMRQAGLGDLLPASERARLVGWMRGNRTGDKRIRAGVPAGWTVADKTGSGDYGTTNDLGILWPPGRAPIVLAVYYTQSDPKAAYRDDVVAEATRLAIAALG